MALHGLCGQIRIRQGRVEDAKEANRRAIRTSVDYDYAIHELFAACETHVERREALLFVRQELMRQVIFGEGLLAFRDTAALALEPEELLAVLREALVARPDLWHAWAALVRQLSDMNRLDEAHGLATQAVERFPLLPALWLDLAKVCRRRDDADGEIAALEKALQINPSLSLTLRQLADAHERQGRLDRAEELLERAIARAPLVALNHAELAELLWRKGEHERAFEKTRHAFELEPGSDQAWDRLCEWARRLGEPERAVEAARALADRRPGEARSWVRLAQAHVRLPRTGDPARDKERTEEAVRAFDRAIFLNPRNPDFYDQKAMALSQAGRFDEALAACRPEPWGDHPPLTLRGRAAWLVAQQQRVDDAIAQMRDVLQEDPKYYWGWSQLADWCQATRRWDEYLQAANAMCQLAPHTAQPLAYRGEARLRTGDRGGLADLRGALKITPDYGLAGLLLFDEHLNAGELDEAGKVLGHLEEYVPGDYVTARAVQLRARQGEQPQALAALRRLCRSHDLATWPLDAAANAFGQAGWAAELKQALRAAVRDGDWHPHVAVLWGERFDARADADLDECLRALDESHRRNAAEYGPLDLKAELLAHGRRYDEALAVAVEAAKVPDFATRARGRHAWVERQRGRTEDAIELMQRVVRDEPGYYWGWQNLAEWYEALGRPADHLRASERLVELGPGNAWNYSHRGAARRATGDRAGAKADFAKGLELSPGFEFIAFNLFDMQLQDGEYDAAEATLARMAGAIHPKEVAYRRVLLARRLNQRECAAAQLPALCNPEDGRAQLLTQAADVFLDAGWAADLARGLAPQLSGPEAGVAKAWVRALDRINSTRMVTAIAERLDRGDVSPACLIGVLDGLIAVKQSKLISGVVSRYEAAYRASTWTWGSVGRVYSQIHDDTRAATWMSDWEEREQPESWMLINLAMSLRGLRRDAEARRVSEHALAKAQADYTGAYHEVWLALDRALAGEIEPVQEYLGRADEGALDDYHLLILNLTRAVLASLAAEHKGHAFTEASNRLAEAAKTLGPVLHDAALRLTYKKSVSAISRNCGTLSARLWALWRAWSPLLPQAKAEG